MLLKNLVPSAGCYGTRTMYIPGTDLKISTMLSNFPVYITNTNFIELSIVIVPLQLMIRQDI
jgi:hypothetical protein